MGQYLRVVRTKSTPTTNLTQGATFRKARNKNHNYYAQQFQPSAMVSALCQQEDL
jgi:hypothetical protein